MQCLHSFAGVCSGGEGTAIQLKGSIQGVAVSTAQLERSSDDDDAAKEVMEFDEQGGGGTPVVAGDGENVPPVIPEQLPTRSMLATYTLPVKIVFTATLESMYVSRLPASVPLWLFNPYRSAESHLTAVSPPNDDIAVEDAQLQPDNGHTELETEDMPASESNVQGPPSAGLTEQRFVCMFLIS